MPRAAGCGRLALTLTLMVLGASLVLALEIVLFSVLMLAQFALPVETQTAILDPLNAWAMPLLGGGALLGMGLGSLGARTLLARRNETPKDP